MGFNSGFKGLKMANARKTIGARAYNVQGDNDKTSIIISNFCVVPNLCIVLCIFVSFYVLFLLCRSLYCLCVYVYCTTDIGWLPNCS